jgi:hypothetical protein
MDHSLYPDHDAVVSRWMAAQGWPVTERFSAPDRELLAWRHRGHQGKYTLRIEEDVLEFLAPEELAEQLHIWGVAAMMREHPKEYMAVQWSDSRGAAAAHLFEPGGANYHPFS